jgi:hypothetical protein
MDLLIGLLKADEDREGFAISYSYDPGVVPQHGTGDYKLSVRWK